MIDSCSLPNPRLDFWVESAMGSEVLIFLLNISFSKLRDSFGSLSKLLF
jgi:hypothetical protein